MPSCGVALNATRPPAPRAKAARVFTPLVLSVLAVALGTMSLVSSSDAPLLLYMTRLSYTHQPHASFYVNTVATGLIVPVVATIPFGHIASHIGAGLTLACGYVFVSLGILIMICSQWNKYLFLAGYVMYYTCSCFRVLRFAIIGKHVPKRDRTRVMAIHQLMVPCGALVGPTAWLVFQTWRGQVHAFGSAFVVDRFTINYVFTFALAIALGVLSYTTLRIPQTPSPLAAKHPDGVKCDCGGVCPRCSEPLRVDYGSTQPASDGDRATAAPPRFQCDLQWYRRTRFLFFGTLILFFRLALVIVLVLLQPVLVHRFGAGDAEIGQAYMIIGLFALIPPIAVALLSSVLDDRYILIFGLLLKLAGTCMYLPPFCAMGKWQAIIGFSLVVKGSSFTTTAAISLYTKILAPVSTEATLGYLWCFGNLVPAVLQVVFSERLVGLFATWGFLWVVLPPAVALAMVVWPVGWTLLDQESELTIRMTS